MGANFLDGPARGVAVVGIRRCPRFLRAVQNSQGAWDTLDQPDDTPREDEQIHPYEIVPGTWNQIFVRPGGEYQNGDYRSIRHHFTEADILDMRARQKWIKMLEERWPSR